MATGFFITGTDTDVGKTWATVALLRGFSRQGIKAAGFKPVAAGCFWQAGRLVNQDALLIQEHAGVYLDYAYVNPYAFEAPLSPHIACGDVIVNLDTIQAAFNTLKQAADCVLVEGAGGWLSPLSRELVNADLARLLALPVIVAVGMRLGCINHARLTVQAIRLAGLTCAGWVAVEIVPDLVGFEETLEYLQKSLEAPLLGVLPHLPAADFDLLAGCITVQL
jgi:dethiobiotin synthetase